MLTRLKNLFKKPEPPKPEPKPKPEPPEPPKLTAKEQATSAGEPYVAILSMDVDPENLHNGSFELDWNDKFILNLVRAGYKMKDTDTDQDIVDRWFQNICRSVVLETYEQEQADPTKRSDNMLVREYSRRDIGNGRAEIS